MNLSHLHKILIIVSVTLTISCSNEKYNITQDMFLCKGEIYNDNDRYLYIKCDGQNKPIKVIPNKFHLNFEREQ